MLLIPIHQLALRDSHPLTVTTLGWELPWVPSSFTSTSCQIRQEPPAPTLYPNTNTNHFTSTLRTHTLPTGNHNSSPSHLLQQLVTNKEQVSPIHSLTSPTHPQLRVTFPPSSLIPFLVFTPTLSPSSNTSLRLGRSWLKELTYRVALQNIAGTRDGYRRDTEPGYGPVIFIYGR